MPQKPKYSGFTPDPETDESGFLPDVTSSARDRLGPPPAGMQVSPYKEFWDTVSSYIPQPVKDTVNYLRQPITEWPSRQAEKMESFGLHSIPAGPISIPTKMAGDFLSSMTSPESLAMTALTGGEMALGKFGLEGLAKGANFINRVVSAPVAAEGIKNMTTAPDWKGVGSGALQAILGSLGMLHSSTTKSPVRDIELPSIEPPAVDLPAIETPSNIELPPQIDHPAFKPDVANQAPQSYRDMIDKMPDDAIADHIARQEKLPGWDTEVGRNSLDHARNVLAERRSNPSVPINQELPVKPAATNLSPEDVANMELWYKLKKVYDSGKMTPDQMLQWGEVHNKVKGLEPNGAVTLRPHRFETLPPEEPQFTDYTLPDGRRVKLDTSATKGADTTSFTLADGTVVEAKKAGEFDPTTLGFEGNTPKPEVEFVDPKTGEIIPAGNAKPGDIPLVPESQPGVANPEPAVPPSKIPGRRRMILTDTEGRSMVDNPKVTNIKSPATNPVFETSGAPPVNQPFEPVGSMPTNQPGLPNTSQPLAPAGIPRQYGPKLPPNKIIGPPLPPRPPRNTPPPIPPQGPIRNLLNIHKAALTSGDLSAPGRQGKAFMFNKAWWTSWDDMVKAWTSKGASDLVHDSIINHPSGYFKDMKSATGGKIKSFADQVGLELPEHEEMFTNTIGKRFGGWIDKSSRAHTAFLNKLRSDQFVSMMDAAKKAGLDPEANLTIPKAYAKFINDATGRGSIKTWKLEKNMTMLNDVFFAPKNMAGQIKTWNNVLNPIKYANYDPVLRKQALRSLLAVAGMGLGVGEVSRLAGAQVSNDPTSSDFRKIKIGDTRIDPFGGYQQFPVAAMKFLTGKSTSTISNKTSDLTSNRFGAQTRADVAERFFTNRLSPVGSFIFAWMSNKEFDGQPFAVKKALYERVFPIALKDIMELAKEDPALAAVTAIPTLTGMTGTQHYTGR